MDSHLTIDQKYELITRNLQEIVGDEQIIKKIISTRPLKIYWGTAPTSRIHIGYFVPMLKLIDFLNAGCEVIILIADLHAVLDNLKSTFSQIELRTLYYIAIIKEVLKSLNVDISRLKFIKGSDFQLSKEYTLDVYKANTLISVNDAKHAGAEVVKQSDNPLITGLLYPTLQALDEQYLGVDIFFGGIDQRKICMHSRKILPLLNYKKRMHLMNPLVPGLRFTKKDTEIKVNEENLELDKMSSSKKDSKIDLLDTKNQLKTKINKTYCLTGDIDDNSLLVILDKIIFPILQNKKLDFVINRPDKFGGEIIYKTIEKVKNDFKNQSLHPADFKLGIIDNLDIILKPIRDAFQTKDLQELLRKAYPESN